MTDLPQHLAIRPLTLEDIDQVSNLENNGFPPDERCSYAGLKYRLKTCPELTSGLFIREFKGNQLIKENLIGHILATKISSEFISEESMQVPDESDNENSSSNIIKGHVESSTNIGLHSLVIHKDYQKRNLATLLIHDFIQKLSNQSVGDKISIISKKNLLNFYKRVGFKLINESQLQHGVDQWYNLQCPLIPENDNDE